MEKYDAKTIEEKWQRVWEDARAFAVSNDELPDRSKKSYVLEMLPYPSGTLHMGHVLVDTIGLPAENAAIKEGGHPREIVERNIEHIRWEFKRFGYAMDWDREFSTHE